jgi:PAS domain S-box-containing protein
MRCTGRLTAPVSFRVRRQRRRGKPKASSPGSSIHRERITGLQAAPLETVLITYAPDAIIFADCAGVIRVWNQGAEALFGHSAAEAVGHTLDLIVPEPYRPAHWAGFSRAVQQGRFAKDDVLLTSRARTKDGRIIAVELSAAIIWSPAGQVRGIMAIGRDVTARRAREQAQQERIASLERQVAALTEALTQAGEGGNVPSGRGREPQL